MVDISIGLRSKDRHVCVSPPIKIDSAGCPINLEKMHCAGLEQRTALDHVLIILRSAQ